MESCMKKIAIICANGMGDLILMSLLAYNAQLKHSVSIFHISSDRYKTLFPQYELLHPDSYKSKDFDLTIVQNDHGELCCLLQDLREKDPSIIFLLPKKSSFQRKGDFLFNNNISFIENLKIISKELFGICIHSSGISIDDLELKKNPNRVLIHPTTQNKNKTWPIKKFKKLYDYLLEKGYEPYFIMSQEEKKGLDLQGYSHLPTPSILELAKQIAQSGYFIGCDSGPGHLASSLNVPTLTISFNHNNSLLWKPAFFFNITITPKLRLDFLSTNKSKIYNFIMHHLIPTYRVKKNFMKLVKGASN